MAHNPRPALAFLLIFNILLAIVGHVTAGRELPTNPNDDTDVKQPEFFKKDRSFLIPGIGRFIKPKTPHGFNPFTYNPVTGSNTGGITGGIGSGTTGGSTGRTQIPGGDDTLIPNPGVEVPTPGTGGSAPPVGGR